MSDVALKFSIIVVTFQRDAVLEQALAALATIMDGRDDAEIVLIDNNVDAVDRFGTLKAFGRVTYRKMGENCGVAGGRNTGIRSAKGEILVFFDDDAIVDTRDALDIVGRAFADDAVVGILAFKSCDKDGRILRAEFPHWDKTRMAATEPFRTYRFTGVGHAVRRSVFEAAGEYRAEFFYAMEESELSFRAMKAGYEIQYLPSIAVRHMHSPAGRMEMLRVFEHSLLNKLRLNYLHLPADFAVMSDLLWLGRVLWFSRGRLRLRHVVRTFRNWRQANRGQRQPINGQVRAYVRSTGGVLWR
jgi:GT2 family glycosyltransferase